MPLSFCQPFEDTEFFSVDSVVPNEVGPFGSGHLRIEHMTIGTIVLGRFVRVVTEFTRRFSQMGIVRVRRYLLRLLRQFRIISAMTTQADLHGNEFGRGVLLMTGLAVEAPILMPVRQK